MKKILFNLILLFMLLTITSFAQKKNTPKKEALRFNSLTSKNTLHFGVDVMPFFIYSEINKNLYTGFLVCPRIDWFFIKNLSVGIDYYGIKSYYTKTPKYNGYFNNAEIKINYFFLDKRKAPIFVGASYFLGQYKAYRNADTALLHKGEIGQMFSLEAGVCWRFKKHPNWGISANFKKMFNLNTPKSDFKPSLNVLSFGVNFYLQKVPAKETIDYNH